MMYNEMNLCQAMASDMAFDKITASKRKYVAPQAQVVELHLSGSVLEEEGAGMGNGSLGARGEDAQSKKNNFSFFDDEDENTGDMMTHQGVWE